MQWCFCLLSDEHKRAIAVDREINRLLQEQKKRDRWELKLLLLGTGESGKSTFIKQMRIIHGVGYTEEDRKGFAKVVYQNIFTSIQAMIKAMETLQIPYARPENGGQHGCTLVRIRQVNSGLDQPLLVRFAVGTKLGGRADALDDRHNIQKDLRNKCQILKRNAQLLLGVDAYKVTTMEAWHAHLIKSLWCDPGIRTCYQRRREYHLLDSTAYFLCHLDWIMEDGYIPSAQDILRTRVPTTGINEYCFSIKKVTLRIVDVGGQKSERRKWIHCFENVVAVIYLASLSEYDQSLEENSAENRMRESLDLFRTILELPWFLSTSIILFLNKTDILEEKIMSSDLAAYFPSFTGPKQDAESAKEFILQMYMDIFHQVRNASLPSSLFRFLYYHYTCATDTQNIGMVFEDVKDAVLAGYLDEFNLV